jgi:predicted RNA-binding Zn-ribbon protein involved in translation (DUF1610 family)
MIGIFWGEEDDWAVKNDKKNSNTDLCLKNAMKSEDGRLIKEILDYTVFQNPHIDKQHIILTEIKTCEKCGTEEEADK